MKSQGNVAETSPRELGHVVFFCRRWDLHQDKHVFLSSNDTTLFTHSVPGSIIHQSEGSNADNLVSVSHRNVTAISGSHVVLV